MNKRLQVLTFISVLSFANTANSALVPWTQVGYELNNENSQSGTAGVPYTTITGLTGNPVATGPLSIGKVTVSASASPGALKASVWNLSNVGSLALTGVTDYSISHATASFFDGITINVSNPALFGQPVTVNGSWRVSGSMLALYNVLRNNSAYYDVYARTMLSVSGTGIPGFISAMENRGASGTGGVTNVSVSAPSVIPVSFTAQLGIERGIQYGLDLQGQTFASFGFRECGVGYGPCGATASAELNADYGNSLLWGGISSITDANGNFLTGFTITSASNFNYLQASSVPLPAPIWLFASSLPIVFLRSHRGRGRSHDIAN